MIRTAALGFLLITASASATDLSGIPQNCEAPLAHDMEMTNIPYLLELGPNAAHITKIDTIGGPDAYQYAPNLYKIDCAITVHWSNGAVDMAYLFSAWQDKYDGLKGYYGPQIRH